MATGDSRRPQTADRFSFQESSVVEMSGRVITFDQAIFLEVVRCFAGRQMSTTRTPSQQYLKKNHQSNLLLWWNQRAKRGTVAMDDILKKCPESRQFETISSRHNSVFGVSASHNVPYQSQCSMNNISVWNCAYLLDISLFARSDKGRLD